MELCLQNGEEILYAKVTKSSSGARHLDQQKKFVFSRISYPHSYYHTNFMTSDQHRKSVFDRLSSDSTQQPSILLCSKERAKSNFKFREADGNQRSFRASNSDGSLLCYRCLSPHHLVCDCRQQIRCKACFRYGHLARSC